MGIRAIACAQKSAVDLIAPTTQGSSYGYDPGDLIHTFRRALKTKARDSMKTIRNKEVLGESLRKAVNRQPSPTTGLFSSANGSPAGLRVTQA